MIKGEERRECRCWYAVPVDGPFGRMVFFFYLFVFVLKMADWRDTLHSFFLLSSLMVFFLFFSSLQCGL